MMYGDTKTQLLHNLFISKAAVKCGQKDKLIWHLEQMLIVAKRWAEE
jgi:hypothetical protein